MPPHNHNILSAASLLQKCQEMRLVKHSFSLRFVDASKEIIARRHGSLKANSLRLIESAKPRIATIEKERHDTASYFNVFSALGVVRKEVIQSRFLAYLLSPKEHHDQGSKFLHALLRKLDIQIGDIDRVRVMAEHSGAEHGRMDIVLDCKPWLIVIEVKIDAGEGDEQLFRYRQWLTRQTGYDEDKKHLIFLTPTGHESVTGTNGDYQQLSYSDVADAFSPLLENQAALPPSVREVLQQYISICRIIGGDDMTTQDKELQALITNPDNLRAALEMEQQTALARKQIAKIFTSNVTKILSLKISSDPEVLGKWKVTETFDQKGNAFIRITTIRHSIKANFNFYAEYLFAGDTGWGKFGWVRPIWIDKKQLPQLTDTHHLSEKMMVQGCHSGEDEWWLASNRLRGGDKGYVLSDNEDIFACHEDNRNLNSNHPMASKIAEEMWTMFTAYRADIEALPSFQQTTTP